MRAVELFCGIGGFRLACDALGIRTVWANDLASESCAIYRGAFGADVLLEGDIRQSYLQVPEHDLLTAGFPCQPFSSAGKKLGVRDPRGTLFSVIVSIIAEKAPEAFVLENVKRLLSMESGEHFGTILDAFSRLGYAIEWRLLNAMHFGLPQNRQRVFLIGRKTHTQQPVVRLASAADLANAGANAELLAMPARWVPIERHSSRFPNWGMAMNGRFVAIPLEAFSAASLRTPLIDLLEQEPAQEFYMEESTRKRIRESTYVNKLVQDVRVLYNQGGGARMGYTVFGTDGVTPTLTASHSRHYERYQVNGRFRRLTNIEYARLQGFPDHHCRGASVFDQYGLYGNAVPPPMAAWAIRQVLSERANVCLEELAHQHDLQLALAV